MTKLYGKKEPIRGWRWFLVRCLAVVLFVGVAFLFIYRLAFPADKHHRH